MDKRLVWSWQGEAWEMQLQMQIRDWQVKAGNDIEHEKDFARDGNPLKVLIKAELYFSQIESEVCGNC